MLHWPTWNPSQVICWTSFSLPTGQRGQWMTQLTWDCMDPDCGLQLSIQHHSPPNPLLQTAPAHCSTCLLSADLQFSDWQKPAGEVGTVHFKQPGHPHRSPPRMCPLSTALLPTRMTAPPRTPLWSFWSLQTTPLSSVSSRMTKSLHFDTKRISWCSGEA